MLDFWGRFIWWLYHDPNAPGVVQAFASIATIVLTAVLIVATVRYVLLTGKLVEASDAVTRAAFMPDIEASIDWTHPRRDELAIVVKNTAEPPLRILRARFLGGTLFRWAPDSSPPNEYASHVDLQPSSFAAHDAVFLRTGQSATGRFDIKPSVAEAGWPACIDYRVSLRVGVVVEVSDIGGRNTFSFTVLRDAYRGGATSIATRSPSAYDKARLSDYLPPVDLTSSPATR